MEPATPHRTENEEVRKKVKRLRISISLAALHVDLEALYDRRLQKGGKSILNIINVNINIIKVY